ncbi:SH2 domain-containing protein 2A [Scleropages formosus]|uniref:SH2 domain-containing protein 2A-like n=1 Tax=Scleropages formosus TaxID=113540 RepID=A0A8C9S917_SCLFO|nr:SH2 domain-containing protein 2A-like [Scleropages formosus]
MDFDYQTIKDAENQKRAEILQALPIPHRSLVQSSSRSQSPPLCRAPPVKPRRSLKARPIMQEKSMSLMTMSLSNTSVALEPLSTALRAHTLLWFETSQMPRLRRPGQPLPCWLHGFTTRREAEELLRDTVQGCFLLRLSETKIGFVLSYRGKDRCRHFIIEEESDGGTGGGGCYLIAGEESRHSSLQDLVDYYTQHPVGPFDEVLTIPFVKTGGDSKEPLLETVGGQDLSCGGADGGDRSDASSAPLAITPALTSTDTPVPPASETEQYAVVKKGLRKSYSLPDNSPEANSASLSLQVPDADPTNSPSFSTRLDDARAENSVDVPYARVNKAPRAPSAAATNYVNIPTVAQEGPPSPSSESAAEQKYWEMVPLHTYEETSHLIQQAESRDHIDFYAMGGRQTAEESAEKHHLYSEINLKVRDVPAPVQIPGRSVPDLPQRPPPRTANCNSRYNGTVQRLDGNITLDQPLHSRIPIPPVPERPLPDPHSSIYEQIPDKGFSSRLEKKQTKN